MTKQQTVSIRVQLVAVFLIVILLPCGLITFIMYGQSIQVLDDRRGDSMVGELIQTAKLVDKVLQDTSYQLNALSVEPEFIALCSRVRRVADYESDPASIELTRKLHSMQEMNSMLESLCVYLNEPNLMYTSYTVGRPAIEVNRPEAFTWTRFMSERQYESRWKLTHGAPSYASASVLGQVVAKKKAVGIRDQGEPPGQIAAVISVKSLAAVYLEGLRASGSDVVMLLDEGGRLIASSNLNYLQVEALSQQPFMERLGQLEGKGHFRSYAFGESVQVSLATSEATGWTYLTLMPTQSYTMGLSAMSRNGILIAVGACFCAVLVALWYSLRLYRPIRQLRDAMLLAESGDLHARLTVRRRDEFQELFDGFNAMIERIGRLMHDLQDERLLNKEAELRNLQAQVNPHFLYNVLETMRWMARLNKTREVEQLCGSLSNFYRATLSKGCKTVTVRETFDMIRDYLDILSARYGDRFTVHFDAPEALWEHQVLHLVLQPLVENAMYHSIEKVDHPANLYVSVHQEGEDLIFCVRDDGVGIDQATLAGIQRSFESSEVKSEGFALKNIHQRLRMFYGEGYGLSIKSAPGRGTIVSVRMRLDPIKA